MKRFKREDELRDGRDLVRIAVAQEHKGPSLENYDVAIDTSIDGFATELASLGFRVVINHENYERSGLFDVIIEVEKK